VWHMTYGIGERGAGVSNICIEEEGFIGFNRL
jgi:hypothetical protein